MRVFPPTVLFSYISTSQSLCNFFSMDPCLISDMVKVELLMARKFASSPFQKRLMKISVQELDSNKLEPMSSQGSKKILIYFPVEKKTRTKKKDSTWKMIECTCSILHAVSCSLTLPLTRTYLNSERSIFRNCS